MKRILLAQTAITLLMIIFFFDSLFANYRKENPYQTFFTKTAPEIDGMENDSCWNEVEWSGDFIQNSTS